MANDPVKRFRERLIADGHATAEALDEMEAGIKQELDEAVTFALESPYPELAELDLDVYAPGVAA